MTESINTAKLSPLIVSEGLHTSPAELGQREWFMPAATETTTTPSFLCERVEQGGVAHRVLVPEAVLAVSAVAKGEDTASDVHEQPVLVTERDARHFNTPLSWVDDAH